MKDESWDVYLVLNRTKERGTVDGISAGAERPPAERARQGKEAASGEVAGSGAAEPVARGSRWGRLCAAVQHSSWHGQLGQDQRSLLAYSLPRCGTDCLLKLGFGRKENWPAAASCVPPPFHLHQSARTTRQSARGNASTPTRWPGGRH